MNGDGFSVAVYRKIGGAQLEDPGEIAVRKKGRRLRLKLLPFSQEDAILCLGTGFGFANPARLRGK